MPRSLRPAGRPAVEPGWGPVDPPARAEYGRPTPHMEVLVLGPLEARLDGRPVPLGAAKQRAVLAMLALHANATVSADELMEGLWGEHPPPSAPKMVQQYISQLRRLLAEGGAGEARIVT